VSSEPQLRPDGKFSIPHGAGGAVRESTDLAWVIPTVMRRHVGDVDGARLPT
jgi:hypothetical protein